MARSKAIDAVGGRGIMGYAYKWAKKFFFLGFGTSVRYYNAETNPDYMDDPDLMELFEETWMEDNLGPVQYKMYLKSKEEESE